MRCLIQLNAPSLKYIISGHLSCSAQNCFHPCHKYLGAERFGYIFIHPQLKSLQFISFIGLGCKHNNRHFGVASDFPAHFPTIHLRHHHVQNHQRDVLLFKENIQRCASILRFHDFIVVLHKEILHQLSHPAFIIYNQNFQPFHNITNSFYTIGFPILYTAMIHPSSLASFVPQITPASISNCFLV
ncbi:hypothetical protein IMSAGC002_04553 [Lachnospiraceae bacterium]|nr:hypothetical protein IMSAGC002_04553 [Lachnospiraceae bacterium]